MTAKTKIAQRKLTMLELAKELDSVSRACRLSGYSRSQFYEIKRAFQLYGFEGLIDKLPMPKSFPNKTPDSVEKRIIELSRENPAWGQGRLAGELLREQIKIDPTTVRKILHRHGMGTRYDRLLMLEEEMMGKALQLTKEQIVALEKANPCFRERHVESHYPGYLLSQDTFFVGSIKGVGKLHLQVVVDTFCSYGFAWLYTSHMAQTAADMVYNHVVPFYEDQGLRVERILTDRGSEYCGRQDRHSFELMLGLLDIEHRRTKVASPQTNGFVERFNRTLLDEFFRPAFRRKLYLTVAEIQSDLDDWLHDYNTQRPHQGYRNLGRTPAQSFTAGLELVPSNEKEVEAVAN